MSSLRELVRSCTAAYAPTVDEGGFACFVSRLEKKLLPALRTFVPEGLVRMLNLRTGPLEPCANTKTATVMLADVSGFTKLSERLCSKGPAGVDELSETMNSYFGTLISLIRPVDSGL